MKRCKDCVNKNRHCYQDTIHFGGVPSGKLMLACVGVNISLYSPRWYIRLWECLIKMINNLLRRTK